MFSFHKPKVYRSSTGCCICKAKSSSSRFTDSRKYEQDFLQCFQLAAPRQGEICNACVLLVKRWKKLPAGSQRNWRHVVDARAGPGMKSMIKFKSKNKLQQNNLNNDNNEQSLEPNEKVIKKHKHISRLIQQQRESSPILSDETTSEDVSSPPSRSGSPLPSDTEPQIEGEIKKCRRKVSKSRLKTAGLSVSSFLDMTFWKREYICCGTIFIGPTGELLLDQRFLKPCSSHQTSTSVSNTAITNSSESIKVKSFSDSSSDSGYDESSNQGNEKVVTESTSDVPMLKINSSEEH